MLSFITGFNISGVKAIPINSNAQYILVNGLGEEIEDLNKLNVKYFESPTSALNYVMQKSGDD